MKDENQKLYLKQFLLYIYVLTEVQVLRCHIFLKGGFQLAIMQNKKNKTFYKKNFYTFLWKYSQPNRISVISKWTGK